ncbi:MAG: glycoside hydrolase family 31 protein [Chitinophagales bacterium]|nr:DUF5110 domain-containing protein [Chitinophagales bacterium]MDW8394030.1 glycoside hydrolase family 31 protein [Chitinophagales bacterium]
MWRKKILLLSLVPCVLWHAGSGQELICCKVQSDSAEVVVWRTADATWRFSSPASGILHVVYRPDFYRTNEQISDAVVLPIRRVAVSVQTGTDTIVQLNDLSLHLSRRQWFVQDGTGTQLPLPLALHDGSYHGFRFFLQPEEQLFGGGGRAIPMNRRGYRMELYNQPHYGYAEGAVNLNFSVPLFFSNRGYALFFDNGSRGYADAGAANSRFLDVAFVSGELNVYVFFGKNAQQLVQRYTSLTGRQPLPPLWALGAFVSRFGYRSRQQTEFIVKKMQEERFPFDAVVLDLFWFGDSIQGTLGNLDWVNAERWPDPPGMIRDFARQGVRTVLITEPFVVETSSNYRASLPYHATDSSGKPYVLTDFYFGRGGLLDLFRNDAQAWFLSHYQKQIRHGVAGWWGDLGEPEKHPPDLYHDLSDLGHTRKFAADEVHNLYGHWWSKMLSDFYDRTYPDVRLFHLNRAGFAGSQRYRVFPWTGDVSRSWSGLRAQLPILLSLSLCGIPYIHSDAGGFAMGDFDPELFTRWVQFSVFTPILRPHGTALEDLVPEVKSIPSEPALYPEPYRSVLRRYYQLRYALMPYLYTLSFRHWQQGDPLMRPLWYDDFSNPNLLQADDQFLLGDALLIAPVWEAQACERRIYLPPGLWYPLFSSTRLNGDQFITVPVKLEELPVFARSGSFIPQAAPIPHTQANNQTELTVDYYVADTASSYECFQDDGLTNRTWETGAFRLLSFQARPEAKSLQLSISASAGRYPGMADTLNLRFRVYGLKTRPKRLYLDNRQLSGGWKWKAEEEVLEVTVAFAGGSRQLRLRW